MTKKAWAATKVAKAHAQAGLDLQLLMKEENWSAIDNVAIPPMMDLATTRQAENLLTFYRATSQLLRPDGQLSEARVALQRLPA